MKILAFGEAMLRFTVPEFMLLEQSEVVRMTTVGTGINLLASLAHFGYDTELLTCLPKNSIGCKMAAEVRRLGISDKKIIYRGQYIGSFFVELGFGNRPERVTYQNRLSSAFCTTDYHQYKFNKALQGVDLVHICGISLSLNKNTREAAINLAQLANKMGIKVCFDFNYRAELNKSISHEKMKSYYQRILSNVDIVFGGLRDLTELLDYNEKSQSNNIQKFINDYDIQYLAGTKRIKKEGQNYFSGFIAKKDQFHESKAQIIHVLDRIGSGDAFASGIITGIFEKYDIEKMLEFAVANAVLAQSTFNDSTIFTRQEVERYVKNHGCEELIR